MNCVIYYCVTVWLLCLFDICNCTFDLPLNNVTRIKRSSTTKCTLPDYPVHGKWELLRGSALPGDEVSYSTVVKYFCHNGYKLISNSPYVVCDDTWNVAHHPSCLKRCQPLHSTATTILKCINGASDEVSCAEATDGTYLTYECVAYYEAPLGYRKSLACKDGKWNYNPPVCQPICGKKVSDAQKLAYGALELKAIEYPWIAAVYQKTGADNFTNVCGGSIISRKVILTAAHCITNDYGNLLNPEDFRVGVGKLYNKYRDPRDKYAEYYEVRKLIKYPKYIGETNLFTGDIGIIVVKKLFNWGPIVQPVCVTNIESIHLTERAVGEIAGWGRKEDGLPSDELRFLKIPYKDQSKCASELPPEWERKYNIEDKMCAGFFAENKSVCNGDSGSGLVFRRIDDNRFYIHGVVSLAPTLRGRCNFQQNSLYTKVASYYRFIDQETTQYYEEECVLPNYPANGFYNIVEGGESKKPGDKVSTSSVLRVTCKPGFVLQPPVPTVECENIAFMPRCLLTCPLPDLKNTASHECVNHEGDIVDCSQAVTGSILRFKCSNGYSPVTGSSNIRSCRNGSWGTPNPGCEISLFSNNSIDIHNEGDGIKIICTYASWASYDGINPQDFDANLCTHVHYAFAGLEETGDIKVGDDTLDVNQGLYRNVTSMKYRNPKLKVLLNIGGSKSTNDTLWANLVASPGRIAAFIGSASYFMRTYNFDGVNIDWHYPPESEKDNYVKFLEKVRQTFIKERWLLTASARSDFEDTGYDVMKMNELLDWVTVKTYDFFGHWSKYTGEHTALYPAAYEYTWEKNHLNVDSVVKNWLHAGLNKKKLLISVAFYARTFKLKNKDEHELHSPITGAGLGDGILDYSEVCSKYDQWTTVWNEEQKSAYKYNDDEWFSYDTTEAIKLKASYVKEQGLLGVNVWSIDADDVFKKCGKKQILLKTLHEGFGHKVNWDS